MDDLSLQHGGQLMWGGWRHSPIRCAQCANGFDWHVISWKRQRKSQPLPPCPQNALNLVDRMAALARWVDGYHQDRARTRPIKRRLRQKTKVDTTAHVWEPAAGGIFCVRCGGFLFEAPQQHHSRWAGDCPAPSGIDDRTRQRCADIAVLELSGADIRHLMFGACLAEPIAGGLRPWEVDRTFHDTRCASKRRLDAEGPCAKRSR